MLLGAVIALNLANVYIDVRINQWNNAFFNAIQNKDAPEFFKQLGIFGILAFAAIVISVYALYLNQMLQIGWRRWLTERYVTSWLANRAYFRLQLEGQDTDNPDQRISEDLHLFTVYVMSLSLGLLTSVVSLVSFLFILWGLSGPAAVPLFGWGTIHVPAYLVWCALLYAGVGTWLTVKIGRPLVPLNFAQQRFEADFRFSLVRLRENAESVAFYRGEASERDIFRSRFANVFDNFWRIMVRRKHLNWFTSFYGQAAVIFPYVVAAPRYFAGEIQMGGLMQVGDAFISVQNSLSFIINSYADIAAWSAVTQRLSTFDRRMQAIAAQAKAPQSHRRQPRRHGRRGRRARSRSSRRHAAPARYRVRSGAGRGAAHHRPDRGRQEHGDARRRGPVAVRLRQVRLGEGRQLFLPQRPYLPLGTLEEALRYPYGEAGGGPLGAVLDTVGLGAFASSLGERDNWAQRLSLGEQQRLAFARVLLTEPALVFFDEATSALDEPAEEALYRLLREAKWRPTIISVGHRSTLKAFHDRALDIARFGAHRRDVLPAAD